jgi:4-diphosphocytidyl-2-C-methyl-D-erythritol kinase
VSLTVRAPAKINLGLEILGKRPDGFHEIRTILAGVSLYDDLRVEVADRTELLADPARLNTDDNLVARAAKLLEFNFPEATARIQLRKCIPEAAGLGGASSDAAATLVALNRLHTLRLSEDQLREYGARLGSDVPFFIEGGYALASGRGEQLLHRRAPVSLYALIVTPKVSIPAKTKTLYGALRPSDFTDGTRTEQSARSYGWVNDEQLLANAFERPLYELVPSLHELKPLMRRAGARIVALSGAGPSHFSFEIDDEERIRSISGKLRQTLGSSADVWTCDLGVGYEMHDVPASPA